MTDSEKLRTTLLAVFCRKGAAGAYCKAFDEWSTDQQKHIMSGLSLEPCELPVFVIAPSEMNVTIITTRHVFWRNNGKTHAIPVTDIDHIDPCLGGRTAKKSDLEQLHVRTFSGSTEVVRVEKGATFSGVWNLLRHFAVLNHKAKGHVDQ